MNGARPKLNRLIERVRPIEGQSSVVASAVTGSSQRDNPSSRLYLAGRQHGLISN
jgi:hypothetical protein